MMFSSDRGVHKLCWSDEDRVFYLKFEHGSGVSRVSLSRKISVREAMVAAELMLDKALVMRGYRFCDDEEEMLVYHKKDGREQLFARGSHRLLTIFHALALHLKNDACRETKFATLSVSVPVISHLDPCAPDNLVATV